MDAKEGRNASEEGGELLVSKPAELDKGVLVLVVVRSRVRGLVGGEWIERRWDGSVSGGVILRHGGW